MTDKELHKIYMQGWYDELQYKESPEIQNPLEYKAYHLGRLHFVLGDEQTKYDCLTITEIIKMIRENE